MYRFQIKEGHVLSSFQSNICLRMSLSMVSRRNHGTENAHSLPEMGHRSIGFSELAIEGMVLCKTMQEWIYTEFRS
jgi:hypothetical protein